MRSGGKGGTKGGGLGNREVNFGNEHDDDNYDFINYRGGDGDIF
jgi:hypothetical protein